MQGTVSSCLWKIPLVMEAHQCIANYPECSIGEESLKLYFGSVNHTLTVCNTIQLEAISQTPLTLPLSYSHHFGTVKQSRAEQLILVLVHCDPPSELLSTGLQTWGFTITPWFLEKHGCQSRILSYFFKKNWWSWLQIEIEITMEPVQETRRRSH